MSKRWHAFLQAEVHKKSGCQQNDKRERTCLQDAESFYIKSPIKTSAIILLGLTVARTGGVWYCL